MRSRQAKGNDPIQVREAAVARYLNTDLTMTAVVEQFGVTRHSVTHWVTKAGAVTDVSNKAELADRIEAVATDKRSPEEKLRLLLEAFALSDEKLGEFLRREGVTEGDLERFRAEAISGLSGQQRCDADRRRIQELERTHTRQDKRLREAEALLDLQKKSRRLGGKGRRHGREIRSSVHQLLAEAVQRADASARPATSLAEQGARRRAIRSHRWAIPAPNPERWAFFRSHPSTCPQREECKKKRPDSS